MPFSIRLATALAFISNAGASHEDYPAAQIVVRADSSCCQAVVTQGSAKELGCPLWRIESEP